jgi:hypothetical protein
MMSAEDQMFAVGATPTAPAGGEAFSSPVQPRTAKQAGCSFAGCEANSSTGVTAMLFVLLLASARRARRIVLMAAVALAGCSSSSSLQHGVANLTVQVDTRPAVAINGDPVGFVQPDSIVIQIMSSAGTVFVSGPKSLFVAGAQVPVGTAATQAVLWAKTPSDPSPLTASSGTLLVNQIDTSPSGTFSISLQGIMKSADTAGPSMTATGDFHAKWAQPN